MIEEAEAAIAERKAEVKKADKASKDAYNAWFAKNKAMKAANDAIVPAAAAVEAILGVNPEKDMAATSKAEKEFYAKFAELRDVALANVAAADALLSRMAK
jgi:hypothetical protein